MTRRAKKGGLVNIAPGNGGGDEGLSTIQAARLIGMNPKTLENWRWKGIGPAYRKIGTKKITYSAASVRAYLEAATITPRG